MQPLDQGIIRTFKTYYRKHVIRCLIARCATIQSPNDIKITPLDAIYWIDAAWKSVLVSTIRNTFRLAGFESEPHNPTAAKTLDSPTASPSENPPIVNDECDEQLKVFDEFLEHITIDGHTMKAADFIDIDNGVSAFNEWVGSCNDILVCDIGQQDDDNGNGEASDDNSDHPTIDSPPKITEVVQILQKLRLFVAIQEPQLHPLISELESKLFDLYIDSKKKKTNNNG